MRPIRSVLGGTLIVAALASCEEAPILRRIELKPAVALPAGASAINGETLRVTVTGLETLKSSAMHVLWGATADGTVLLGKLGSEPFSSKVAPATLAALTELLVTEEAVQPVPQAPSAAVRLRGAPGGPLAFAPVTPERLAGAAGVAVAQDTMLMVSSAGLPALRGGLTYALWARFPPCTDAERETRAAGAADAGTSGGEGATKKGDPQGMVRLGILNEAGALHADPGYLLATAQELVVTIESARGEDDGLSPIRVLRGAANLELAAVEEEAGEHSH